MTPHAAAALTRMRTALTRAATLTHNHHHGHQHCPLCHPPEHQ